MTYSRPRKVIVINVPTGKSDSWVKQVLDKWQLLYGSLPEGGQGALDFEELEKQGAHTGTPTGRVSRSEPDVEEFPGTKERREKVVAEILGKKVLRRFGKVFDSMAFKHLIADSGLKRPFAEGLVSYELADGRWRRQAFRVLGEALARKLDLAPPIPGSPDAKRAAAQLRALSLKGPKKGRW